MRTLLMIFVLLSGAALAAPLPGTAEIPVTVTWEARFEKPRWTARIQVGSATLRIFASGEKTARRSGEQFCRRLQALVRTTADLRKLNVVAVRGGAALTHDGRTIWTVTADDAAPYQRTPQSIVSAWVDSLQKVRPAGPGGAWTLGSGEKISISLPKGWKPSRLTNGVASWTAAAGRLTVWARQPGEANLVFTRGGQSQTLHITVRPKAGQCPAGLTLPVMGKDVDLELVQMGLERALGQQLKPAPEAEASAFWGMLREVPATAPVAVTVWLEGDNLAAVATNVRMKVAQMSGTLPAPARLAASNHPEMLVAPAVLLDAKLPRGTSWYYYHHHNARGTDARSLVVSLHNPGTRPLVLWLSHSGAGPSKDEIFTGHVATWRFLRWLNGQQAWQVRLQPGETYVLDHRWLEADFIAAGIGLLSLVEGDEVGLKVEAIGGGDFSSQIAPSASVRGCGVYPKPEKVIHTEYVVDASSYTFIKLGDEGSDSLQAEGLTPNTGNYGVLYRIKLRLANPTDAPKRLFAVFAARGGPARGSLKVDTKLIETPLVGAQVGRGREFGIGDWTLAPGQNRTVEIWAIPEPGSNYPVHLIVKPLPAEP